MSQVISHEDPLAGAQCVVVNYGTFPCTEKSTACCSTVVENVLIGKKALSYIATVLGKAGHCSSNDPGVNRHKRLLEACI